MRRAGAIAAGLSVIALSGLLGSVSPLRAGGLPANKVSASGSTAEVVSPGEVVTLLSEKIRTSNPTDLILSATAECAITTEVTTVGNDSQSATGQVRMWIEIDGAPVPVAQSDTDGGRVVFCNRTYQRETSLFDDEDATIRTLVKTREANGFNWLRLQAGSGIHLVELKAEFLTESTSNASALAAVGNRTLIVEPTKAAHNEEVTDLAS